MSVKKKADEVVDSDAIAAIVEEAEILVADVKEAIDTQVGDAGAEQESSESQEDLVSETVSPATTEIDETSPELIAYFEGNNIPYCKKCKKQFVSDLDSSPICPASVPECPRV
jgi:hypothetical protein